jgi:hypothetical protein
MVVFKLRKVPPTIEEVQTFEDMARYFEWYAKLNIMSDRGIMVQLSACPICSGLDPNDPNAALPEHAELYRRVAGHKRDCKLGIMLHGNPPEALSNQLPTLPFQSEKYK